MSPSQKTLAVSLSLSGLFVALAAAFSLDLFGHPSARISIPTVSPEFTNTATVRLSAAQQFKAGGDTSGLECYSCHEKGKAPVIKTNADGSILLVKEHEDLVMQHGRNHQNNQCYNCHDPEKLDTLKTREGRNLKWEESTLLCAGCHGPTYRDWEVGIHGRTSGYWDRSRGSIQRQECASCHHPHSPRFPSIAPAPGPHLLHPQTTASESKVHSETSH